MKLHDNTVSLSVTVQEPREGQVNPRRISEKFASVQVEIGNPKGKCWMEVVGNGSLVNKLSALTPGKLVNVTGRLDSNKGSDGRWRTRLWADSVEVESDQQTFDTEETA